MMRRALISAVLLVVLAWCGGVRGDGPRGRISPNLARVVTATYLGGPGSEWLSAAAFLPDGDILLCGVTADAEVSLGGQTAAVIGTDCLALRRIAQWERLGEAGTGKIAVPDPESAIKPLAPAAGVGGLGSLGEPPSKAQVQEKQMELARRLASCPRNFQWSVEGDTVESRIMYRRLAWLQPEATGFLGVFSGDLKTVRKLLRLPRGAGSITSAAMGKDGAIYIAGAATERIAKFAKPLRTETIENPKGVSENTYGCRRTYLARLSGDAAKVEWLRDIHGWSVAPVLRVLNDGAISMHGPGIRTYSPAGECLRSVSIENTRVVSGLDVSPVDGRYIRVGDWMSGTGREPYRNPRLYVYNPEGSVHKQLYGWRGPFVGVDALRLVADSAVRKSAYDEEGNLVVSTWSHGGNNAMFRYPYDVERYVPNRMGYSPMTTCVSVIKMDRSHNVIASTRTPVGRIEDLDCAVDGSIVWLAHYRYLDKLPNAVSDLDGGFCLAVTDPGLTGYRFLSPMPACGTRVAVSGCYDMVDGWNFATGMSAGKPMLLCLTGAVAKDTIADRTVSPPLKNPVQPTFGGGLTDGYALLLDLTAKEPWPQYVEPNNPPRPHRPYTGPALAWPGEGQVFNLGTERYITVKATFRDPNDAKWPTFFQGRATPGGKFAYGTAKATAEFVLDCPEVLQDQGLQNQRVCGELVKFTTKQGTDGRGNPRTYDDLDNKVQLVVTRCSPWQQTDRLGSEGARVYPIARCTLDGQLHVGPRTVELRDAECSAVFRVPRGVDASKPGTRPNMATLVTRFTVPGSRIGLTGALAAKDIRVQFTFSAASAADYSNQKEKIEVPKAPTLN